MDENKKYIHFLLKCFLIVFFLLFIIAGFVIYVDPFYHYHGPLKDMNLYVEKEAYQNLGLAKNLEYDSFITGSSMTENFRTSQFEKLYGGKVLKFPFSGGRIKNYEILFDTIFKNKNIRNVFYGLDVTVCIDEREYMPNKIPEYLYDNNVFSDVEYLFNKEVMINYAMNYFKNSLETDGDIDWDYAYVWYQYYNFSEEEMRSTYKREEKQDNKSDNIYATNVNNNIEIIEKYIQENPTTQFHIFLPPYSIICYDYYNQKGELEAMLKAYETIIRRLIRYPNVKLSAFYADKNIICNLDNYKDYTHYSNQINEYIAESMKAGTYELKSENVDEFLEESKTFFLNFDYDSLF